MGIEKYLYNKVHIEHEAKKIITRTTEAKNVLRSQCSHLPINPDKGTLSKTAFISCKSAKINELFN